MCVSTSISANIIYGLLDCVAFVSASSLFLEHCLQYLFLRLTSVLFSLCPEFGMSKFHFSKISLRGTASSLECPHAVS